MLATEIKWDLRGYEETILPTEIEIPDDVHPENVSDYLSKLPGFCHFGYTLEE